MDNNQTNNTNIPVTQGVNNTVNNTSQPVQPVVNNSSQQAYQIPGVVIAPPVDNSNNPRVVEQTATTPPPAVNNNLVQQEVTPNASANTNISESVPNNNVPNENTVVNNAGSAQNNNVSVPSTGEKKKNKTIVPVLLFLVIFGLIVCIVITNMNHNKEILKLKDECTPVSTSGDTKELELNSTIVRDLYSKIKTNIREDLANYNFDEEMKLYLAYRQLANNKIYNSNCNYFSDTKMYAFSCKESTNFKPTAFKEEDLVVEYKKLFGETSTVIHDDIQLANSCFGGYQYIAERGEYVKGECGELSTTSFKVDKELIKATSTESTIILYEKVKFYGSEGKEYPEKLKSGTYKYTFKLDQNYNYVFINREYEV